MRDDTPSRTAAYVAVARHAARLLPKELQLADDPYGAAFASPRLAKLIEWRAAKGPGGFFASFSAVKRWILYMQVRTRVIDDAVRSFIAGGGRQVVLLGAGFDTRALRLPELEDARVFEVDHPATQSHKRMLLDRIHADSHSTYLPWHFEQRPMADLPRALAESGHDGTSPTLTIWEGVTMYLTEAAIDASLRAIHAWSKPLASRLVMTYFARDDQFERALSTRAAAAVVSRLGEPWTWGWKTEELSPFLAARGLRLLDDTSIADAATRLLPPDAAKLLATRGTRRIATASPENIAMVSPAP